jgi:hypothetical protein
MKKIILIGLLAVSKVFAHGSEGVGGGDANEIVFKDVAVNIKAWIVVGNSRGLQLPPGLSQQTYESSMLGVLTNYNITMTDKPVLVNGAEKTCQNTLESSGHGTILCNISRFEGLRNRTNDLYRLVHHEFASLARIEKNIEAVSDYVISDQISSYLKYEAVLRLPIVSQSSQNGVVDEFQSYTTVRTISLKKGQAFTFEMFDDLMTPFDNVTPRKFEICVGASKGDGWYSDSNHKCTGEVQDPSQSNLNLYNGYVSGDINSFMTQSQADYFVVKVEMTTPSSY